MLPQQQNEREEQLLSLDHKRQTMEESNLSISTAHRVSITTSVSSSSLTLSNPCPKKAASLKRTVSSLSSTEGTSTQLRRECKLRKPNEDEVDRRLTRFINARILQRDASLLRGSITVDPESGLIVEINLDIDEVGEEKHEETLMNLSNNSIINVIDCKEQIISPGFIDIQLNGAYGVDFSCVADLSSRDLSVEDVLDVAEKLTSTGVTSFCPTMVSSSRETYRRVIPLMRKAREQQYKLSKGEQKRKGAKILGMHLEGPFFASSKRGAHDGRHIFAPSKGMASVNEAYGLGNSNNGRLEDIDIITLAPELDGALDAIKSLTANQDNGHSVVISCGHTEATYEDGIQAVKSGATLLTHLYNAMNSFHHRTPGLVGLLSSELKLGRAGFERPYYSMIVDGIHVHESAVCMAYNSHPSGCVLVTDAIAAMGLGNGIHSLGGMSVCIQGDRATLSASDTLAGSVVSMDTCVQRFKQFTGCSNGEALLCATLHPAIVLKRNVAKSKLIGAGVVDAPIGVLEVGATADLLLLNDDLEVLGTWVGGTKTFERASKLN